MIRALIVDDESSGREILTHLLGRLAIQIEIVGEASNVSDAVTLMRSLRPDLLILDVEMPTGTGFDVLRQIKDMKFEVIFVTAYDKYAIEAFRFSAIDYLMKPVEKSELEAAINKLSQRIAEKEQGVRVQNLLESIQKSNGVQERIILPTQDGFQVIKMEEVIWCQGDGAYTRFYLTNGKQILVSKMLKEYESILEGHRFFRIHRSYLVNLSHVSRYFKGKGGDVEMSDGSLLAVSRERKEEFLGKLL